MQWAFGRSCGLCDTGHCDPRRNPNGHTYNVNGMHHVYSGPRQLVNTIEEGFITDDRFVNLADEPKEYRKWQDELQRQRDCGGGFATPWLRENTF
jgi:hypothetical protein